jgi:hypothetical protein
MYIYVLKCPSSGDVRYVGKANSLRARLRQHIHEANCGGRSHKCAWIRKVLRGGRRPIIAIDRRIPPGECWKAAERERISFYRAQGCRLTNSTDGGDGEGPVSDDVRAEFSRRSREYFSDPEARQRQSEMMKRLCSDPEWLAERTAAVKATRSTPEWRAEQSRRSKALWDDPAYRAKMKAGRMHLYSDPDFRRRLSEANKRVHSDPEVRRMRSEKAKAAWARPDVRERQLKAMRTAVAQKDAKVG